MDVEQIEAVIGYTFKDRELLARAMKHADVGGHNNASLACLGDRIFNVWVARRVFRANPDSSKASLTNRINALIEGRQQATWFVALGLDVHLELGGATRGTGGQVNATMASTAFEAVVAAIELDGGAVAAETFLDATIAPLVERDGSFDTGEFRWV